MENGGCLRDIKKKGSPVKYGKGRGLENWNNGRQLVGDVLIYFFHTKKVSGNGRKA